MRPASRTIKCAVASFVVRKEGSALFRRDKFGVQLRGLLELHSRCIACMHLSDDRTREMAFRTLKGAIGTIGMTGFIGP